MFKDLNCREDFLDFLEKHPEITVSVDKENGGYIVNFPEGAEQPNYTYCLGQITLSCIYNEKEITFPPKKLKQKDEYN